jgi:hypothetical protein
MVALPPELPPYRVRRSTGLFPLKLIRPLTMRTLLFTTLLIVLVTGTLQDSTAITNGGQVSAPEPSARSSASYGSMSLE